MNKNMNVHDRTRLKELVVARVPFDDARMATKVSTMIDNATWFSIVNMRHDHPAKGGAGLIMSTGSYHLLPHLVDIPSVRKLVEGR